MPSRYGPQQMQCSAIETTWNRTQLFRKNIHVAEVISGNHWGKQDDDLLSLIENSETELQRDGIQIAGRFFAERPAKFAVHLDERFKDRHHRRRLSVAEALLAA